ncbi:MAG: replicative DNA helicase [Candidatus Yonathbacteria bacterium RIFCSPHIGHO2_01_FULL_51_10]|uniref:Replicative DNA helicase n=1 Tax=Candidatus Yonathbacteria bacterium RIFCSPHIGHO2_01_FULL_51_10 TaxID=1802723 RepID=A0A1G2S9Z3_9BACT|nr:MAG: replicative DNA helicase [Candidatus Yonathbacteria bacterium RIFCSPHIGHO2_01_FULL_51_10]
MPVSKEREKTSKKQFRESLRVPPQNIDSERALLGSIMLKPDSMHDVADLINDDSFYAEKHRMIFRAMFELHTRREPIDLLSVSSRLKEKGMLEQVGGNAYLAEIVSVVPSATNATYYAEIVRRKYILRNLIGAADTIAELGYSEAEDIDQLLEEAEKKVMSVSSLGTSHQYLSLSDTLDVAWDRLDGLHNGREKLRGVPTGFPGLDNKLAGLQPEDLIILAARPSMGKTSLALDIARQTALKHQTPVCIFSLEMSSQQLADRMLAAEARVDGWKLRTGKITSDEDFERLRDSMARLAQAPIYIDEQSANTITKMRATARRIKAEHGLGLIVVDYLQLMAPSRNYDSMVNQVTEISRALKGLAKELSVPVLALSQLSRAVEQRRDRPRLSDLRDSGSIEQDADVVMFIHRDDKMNQNSDRPNIAEILIEKHRNGPTGKTELYFDERQATFLTIEGGEYGNAAATPSARDNLDDF